MIQNIIFYFILPWVVIIFILKVDFKTILLVSPLASIIAHIINIWTISYHFVELSPYHVETNLASLPMILGIVPTFSSVLIYLIKISGFSIVWIIIFTFALTFLEAINVHLDNVRYFNGWNFIWTYLSYLIGFCIVYGYYKLLKLYEAIQ